MSHWHDSHSASQNVGNVLGDRSCVRQSKLYRQHESGNATKALLGQDNLVWDINKKEGAYDGQAIYDHNKMDHRPAAGGRVEAREISTRVTQPLRESNSMSACLSHDFSTNNEMTNNRRHVEEMAKPPKMTMTQAQTDRQAESDRAKSAYQQIRAKNLGSTSLW